MVSSGVQWSLLLCRLLSSMRTKSLLLTPGGKRPSAKAWTEQNKTAQGCVNSKQGCEIKATTSKGCGKRC